ncbi:SH3 domain-containing kinase-binding protein 1 isoform X2 [Latimeria chalumnae]|uniref:SH3 domain-containing kinase-binding protein 1 isoform X2 n=1 Tax=Latimeria chalumnae TaxID=7897 RepID=UPI00313EAF85
MVEAIVEFDYKAQHNDELTITVGDIITNIKKDDGGWWEGELGGRRGLFPDNFVRELKRDMKKENSASKAAEKPSNEVANGSPMLTADPTVASLRKGEKNRQRRCKVAFSYLPQNEDELELKVGDVIEVLGEVEEGWWEGTLHGKRGLFPSNFIKELPEVEGAGSTQEEQPIKPNVKDVTGSESDGGDSSSTKSEGASDTPAVEIQPKKIKGVGFGDIFKDKPIKLRPRSMEVENDVLLAEKPIGKKLLPASTTQEPLKIETDNRPKTKEYCKVLFPYEAQNEDELTIKEGDIVFIISKDCADVGWWEGEINGKRGVFPDNFVKLLPPDFEKERPKKPPPPSAPGVKSVTEKKTEVKKTPPERPESLPTRTEDKDRIEREPKPVDFQKPTVPVIPPKKPRPPKTNSLSKPSALPPKRPERPAVPVSHSRCDSPKSDSTVPSTLEKEPLEKTNDIDLEGFDSIVATSEKLNHPTASRPKATGRRPKSQTSSSLSSPDLFESPSPEEDQEEREKTEHDSSTHRTVEVAKRCPRAIPVLPVSDNKATLPPKPGSSVLSSNAHPSAASSLHPSSAATAGHRPNSPSLFSSEVKTKTESTSQGQQALEELRTQVKDVKNLIEMMKRQHKNEITQLMNELDEEKRIRISLQMEVEQIKKALQLKK